MVWQDVALFVGGLALAGGIVPAIRGAEKPPVATTLTMVVTLVLFTVVFATLGLWLSAISVVAQGVLWGVVLAQTVRRPRAGR